MARAAMAPGHLPSYDFKHEEALLGDGVLLICSLPMVHAPRPLDLGLGCYTIDMKQRQ